MSGGMFARPRLVAISRSATYSPLQHGANDTAILEATVSELERLGWSAHRFSERDVVTRALPPAELYLNMCQGPAASHALLEHEAMGHRFINRPSSVLRCHRHRLVPALAVRGIPFPATLFLSTEASLTRAQRAELASLGAGPFWLKRGGVHAERPEDVLRVEPHELDRGLGQFAARGITLAAVRVVPVRSRSLGTCDGERCASRAAPRSPGRATTGSAALTRRTCHPPCRNGRP